MSPDRKEKDTRVAHAIGYFVFSRFTTGKWHSWVEIDGDTYNAPGGFFKREMSEDNAVTMFTAKVKRGLR